MIDIIPTEFSLVQLLCVFCNVFAQSEVES